MQHDDSTVWSFRTKNFTVTLEVEAERGYRYDGEDPDGEVQAKIDAGEYVAFESSVVVYYQGEEIARDSLGGSVYHFARVSEFWTEHRDPDPMIRNCSIGREKRGGAGIGHYFPDMIQQAINDARKALKGSLHLRETEAPSVPAFDG